MLTLTAALGSTFAMAVFWTPYWCYAVCWVHVLLLPYPLNRSDEVIVHKHDLFVKSHVYAYIITTHKTDCICTACTLLNLMSYPEVLRQ